MTSDEAKQALKVSHYEYKNNKYTYLAPVMMKCPDSGIWRNAVMYRDMNGSLYVREKCDFDLKFKKMEIME